MSWVERVDETGKPRPQVTAFDPLEGQPPAWPVPLGSLCSPRPSVSSQPHPLSKAAATISFQCGGVQGGRVVTFLLTATLWLPLAVV